MTMKTKYDVDEITWDTIARSMLENSAQSENKNLKLQERLELCFSVYESAIEKLETPKIWQLYVETLFELHDDENIQPKVVQKLNDVCHRAVSSQKLLENHVEDWFELLESSNTTRYDSTLETAVEQFPKNATLWIKRMKSLLEKKDFGFVIEDFSDDMPKTSDPIERTTEVPQQFWKAVECVGDVKEAIPLWETVIDHFVRLSREQADSCDVVEQLYQRAVVAEPPISTHFKARLLGWISSRKGLEEGRRYFREQANIPPLVLDFHLAMIDMELEATQKDLQLVRNNFDSACLLFGQNDIDVWFRYIRFELDHGEALRVGRIHNRAKSMLDASLVEKFLTQCLLLKLQG